MAEFTLDASGLTAKQGPDDRVDYALDFGDWLVAGDTISSVEWTAQPGLTAEDGGVAGSVATVWVSDGEPGAWSWVKCRVTTAAGRRTARSAMVYVDPGVASASPASIFPVRGDALRGLRARLALVDPALLPPELLSDELLWDKLVAAEANVAGRLGVPLVPTEVFTEDPTPAELAALAGAPYIVEPGYDLPPEFFGLQTFGAIMLRMRPVISVRQIRFIYPSTSNVVFTVPPDWIRVDRKYGHVRLYPSAQIVSAPISVMTLQAMGAGTTIPHMIRVRYSAGLLPTQPEAGDVRDLVLQGAGLRIMQDAHIPQSGSLSADGLSQSISLDVSKSFDDWVGRVAQMKERLLGPVWNVM